MPRTLPACPMCAARVLADRDGGGAAFWDIAERVDAVRRALMEHPEFQGREAADLQIAADCLRVAVMQGDTG